MSLYTKIKCLSLSWLLALELVAMPLSHAQNARKQAPAKAKLFKWIPSKLIEKNVGEQKISLRTFERHVWIGRKLNIPVANLTLLKTEKIAGKDKQSVSEVTSLVRDTIKDAKWTRVATEQGEMYQGDWDKMNRVMMVYVYDIPGGQVVASGFVRKGFAKVALKEMQRIMLAAQSYDALKQKNSERKTSLNFIKNLVIENAYAQGLPNFNIDDLLPGWSGGGGSTGGIGLPPGTSWPGVGQPIQVDSTLTVDTSAGVNGHLDNLNGNLNGIVDQSQAGNANWGRTNEHFGDLNQNAKDANANWADTNQNLQNANQQLNGINSNWASSNTQLNRLNGSLEKLTDPAHLFKMGLATSAGMVLGGFLMNMVLDGAIEGISSLWDWLSGARDKRDRAKRFENAAAHYGEIKEAAVKLERILDRFVEGLAALEQGDLEKTLDDNMFAQLMERRQDALLSAELYREQAKYSIKDSQEDRVCKRAWLRQAEADTQLAADIAGILNFAAHYRKSNQKINMATLCAKLDQYLNELILAEELLLRISIFQLGGQDIFLEKEKDDADRMFVIGDGVSEGDYLSNGDVEDFRDTLRDGTQDNGNGGAKLSDADSDEPANEGQAAPPRSKTRGVDKPRAKVNLSSAELDRHVARAGQKAPSWVNICAGWALKPKPEHDPIYQSLHDRVSQIADVNDYNRPSKTRDLCWDYYEDVVAVNGGVAPTSVAAPIGSPAAPGAGSAGSGSPAMPAPARTQSASGLSSDQLIDRYGNASVPTVGVNRARKIVFNRQFQERALNARLNRFQRVYDEAFCHDEVLSNRSGKRAWCQEQFPEIYNMVATQAKARDVQQKKCGQQLSGARLDPAMVQTSR